jgi:hypothetical protein
MTFYLSIGPAIILSMLGFRFGIDIEAEQAAKLKTYEIHALKKNVIGKTYSYNLVGNRTCDKTRIKYLGEIRTKNGKPFRIVTSVFIQRKEAGCRSSSFIKIYDAKNRYIGQYTVEVPEDLPDTLIQNKLIYRNNSATCDKRKGYSVELANGLPKTLYLPCSTGIGDVYHFTKGK